MKFVFWAAVALIAYAYIGYLGFLWLRAKLRPRPAMRQIRTLCFGRYGGA